MSGEAGRLRPLKIEDLLQRTVYDVDEEPHIEIKDERGVPKELVKLCPCSCYTMVGERLVYSYEGCLECGLCRVLSEPWGLRWEYPKSGRGVQYRFT